MIFDSAVFLFAFMPIMIASAFFSPKRISNLVLVLLSFVFYAWGNISGIVVLLVSVIINYIGAIQIAKVRTSKKRAKKKLFIFCGIDVLLLIVCKYISVVLGTLDFQIAENEMFLAPIGISFYMLQNIAYLLDVYSGESRAIENIVDYAACIAMFPKLTAGPFCALSQLKGQLKTRKATAIKLYDGLLLFVQGLAKKVLLGGGMYVIFMEITNLPGKEVSVITAWLGCFAFFLRIYFELSGYYDMGRGLAKIWGIDLVEQMNYPILSKGIMDFWSRHMKFLWDWFRNYVYLPLTKGRVKGAYGLLCLCGTWILMGLWHGLALHYVIWGIYFALLIYLEGFVFYGFLEKIPSIIRWIFTMFGLLFGWALFFNPTIQSTGSYLLHLFGISGSGFVDSRTILIITDHVMLWILAILFATPLPDFMYKKMMRMGGRWQMISHVLIYAGMFVLSVSAIMSGIEHAFYYLRF